MLLFAFAGSAFALQHEITPFSNAILSGSLTSKVVITISCKELLRAAPIKAVLYKISSSGCSYVTETSNSGYVC